MKNRDLGPLGPSNLDPIYVIYVFGSMLSCILCERQKFQKVTNWSALVPDINSEQRDLWPFWLMPVALIQWNEWSKICVYVVKGPQIVKKWHQIDDSSLLQKCQFCMLAMYKGQYHAEND